MSAFQQLPPDQRATLSLLLRRGKSYAEVADALEIEPRAVHDRAHAALAMLAPSLARGVPQDLRERIADYLLGQQDAAEAERTRDQLAASPAARDWAQALAAELAPVASRPLPVVPEVPAALAAEAFGLPAASESPATTEPPETAAKSPVAPALAGDPGARVSRRRGLAVLGVIAAVVIVAIVILVSGGKGGSRNGASGKSAAGRQAAETKSTGSTSGSKGSESGTSESAASESSTTGGAGSGAKVEATVTLSAPNGGHATGGAVFASEKGEHVFLVAAEHLEPAKGFEYVAWLIGPSGEAQPLGIAEPLKEGKLEAGNRLPSGFATSGRFELTRDVGKKPSKPGQVVLQGSYKLK
ncbi:MAG: RNA polymerase sigma factor [Solirubrobacteraceae bacterium]